MSFERFERWLDAYKHAWEKRDPDAAQAIFTEDASYQETPFQEPMMYREGVRTYWANVTPDQQNVQFGYRMLAAEGDTGICHWNVQFDSISENAPVEIDGIFVFTLTQDDLCREFKEWWHYRTLENDRQSAAN